jgi:chemotaxis protein methyltransferase CheR
MTNLISINDSEYVAIKNLVYEKFGIDLGAGKQSLVLGRLQKVVKQNGFESFRQYYKYVVNDRSGEGLNSLINRISTNHTYFNRESEHFDFFSKQVLPHITGMLKKRNENYIRIWSAGCSFGEEPYTLAMLISEHLNGESCGWQTGVLGTDISERVLKACLNGIYNQEDVERLPVSLRHKYFRITLDKQYEVIPKLKKMVMYRRLNLMRPDFPFNRKFHTIFCRNVMIYFDMPTREKLIERFYKYLEPEGYLFIGHSESLGRSNRYFRYIQPAVYQKQDSN